MKKLLSFMSAAVLATATLVSMPSSAHHTGGSSAGKVIATGLASYYGARFAGRRTANGEIFNPSKMTAAHKTMRFGTKLRVTNIRNGRSVVVRINDRGPYAGKRIIDLSRAAAQKIGMINSGVAKVRLQRVN